MTDRIAWHLLFVLVLVLVLLTEGLQFFAIDRHPRLVDVSIALAGAGLGLVVAWVIAQCSGQRGAYMDSRSNRE